MTTLRIQIALFMLAAIVAVVAVATAVTIAVMNSDHHDRMPPEYARQLALTAELLNQLPDGMAPTGPLVFGRLQDRPAAGTSDPAAAAELRGAIRGTPPNFQPMITSGPNGDEQVSLPAGKGWLVIPFPGRPPTPPPPFLGALTGWILMIVAGAAAVAFFAAQRIVRPLGMIESAVASVGRDGILPLVPEQGPSDIRETAAALNRLSRRLKSSMESRMRLVAAAGHDLRTPMTRMRLRAEFLPEEEQKEWLADIDEMDVIADSAIGLVREEAAGEDQEPIALDRLIEETIRELREAQFEVTLGECAAVTVSAGALALKRALRNLVINAATHGGGARVRLSRSDGFAVITVADSGPGIPEDMIERAFEPFFRPDPARQHSVPGAGLGLAIAREIVERFHGRIEISNRTEGGLLQRVFLPVDTDTKTPAGRL